MPGSASRFWWIAAPASRRVIFMFASATTFHLLSHYGYYAWVMERPGIDGGPLGFLTWTIPLLVGSLAYDAMVHHADPLLARESQMPQRPRDRRPVGSHHVGFADDPSKVRVPARRYARMRVAQAHIAAFAAECPLRDARQGRAPGQHVDAGRQYVGGQPLVCLHKLTGRACLLLLR